MGRRFVNFLKKIDNQTNSNEIVLYQPGIIPTAPLNDPNTEVSGQIFQLWIRCFFPDSKSTFADGSDTYYYSDKLIKLILKDQSNQAEIINFVPWASGRPYYEDLRARFSPNLPFQIAQNTQLIIQLSDIGEGLLSEFESIDLYGSAAEEWDIIEGL